MLRDFLSCQTWQPFCYPLWVAALLLLTGCVSLEELPRGSGHMAGRVFLSYPSGSAAGGQTSIQQEPCTYTFLLPTPSTSGGNRPCWSEVEGSSSASSSQDQSQYQGNPLKGDAPLLDDIQADPAQELPSQRLQHLELVMVNYTQWLKKVESTMKESLKFEMAQLQQSAVLNHTVAILGLGTNILTQTVQQTRILTDMETQVLNRTSMLEIQLLKNSLSTNKLETRLLHQTTNISNLQKNNRLLEQKLEEMESRHQEFLFTMRQEMASLDQLVAQQSSVITGLQNHLDQAAGNNTILLNLQQHLRDTAHRILELCSRKSETGVVPNRNLAFKQRAPSHEESRFRDCSDIYKAGFNTSGVYTIYLNPQENKKVYCNMEAVGGGWIVIQRRSDGTMDFQRTWKEYKMGFGSLFGEHWLGNEFVFLLTNQRPYNLRVELMDWDGQQAFSQYDQFYIGSEKQNYRETFRISKTLIKDAPSFYLALGIETVVY